MPNGGQYPPPPGAGPYPPPPGHGAPPGYPPPDGFYPPLSVGESISGAIELYKNNFFAFFIFWSIPAILGIIFGIFQIYIIGPELLDFADVGSDEMPDWGQFFSIMGMTAGFGIVIWIINILFTGGIIGMTKEAMRSGQTVSGTGFGTISKYFGNILITSIVISILVAIGFLLCCIPGIFFCYWWMFAVTAVVVEGIGLSEAMDRSKEFATTRKTFGFAIVLILIIIIMNIVAGAISGLISISLTVSIGYWPGQIASTIIGQIFQWIITPFAAIATAFHYIRGRNIEEKRPHGAPVPYPPPPPPEKL
jgi:hypothetical protein